KVTWTIDDHCDAGGVWNSFVSSPTAEQVACGPPICDWDTTPEQPDWAPNGQKMAMVGCNFGIDPTIDLWIVNLTGSPRLTQLTNTPPGMDEQRPDFSPDSTRIVYMMNGIRVINADGTGDTLLVQGGLPEWSPTGDKI